LHAQNNWKTYFIQQNCVLYKSLQKIILYSILDISLWCIKRKEVNVIHYLI